MGILKRERISMRKMKMRMRTRTRTREEGGGGGGEEEEEEEIDIEAWKWWPKEYHVLVNGTYKLGGMTEEMLLGDFEERVEKLGFKVPEQRYLEVRKVIKKQVEGEWACKISF